MDFPLDCSEGHMKKNSLRICSFVSGSKIKGQKNIFLIIEYFDFSSEIEKVLKGRGRITSGIGPLHLSLGNYIGS